MMLPDRIHYHAILPPLLSLQREPVDNEFEMES